MMCDVWQPIKDDLPCCFIESLHSTGTPSYLFTDLQSDQLQLRDEISASGVWLHQQGLLTGGLALLATTYESAWSYLVILFSSATNNEPLCQAIPLGSFWPLSRMTVRSDVPVFLLSSRPYTLPDGSGPVTVPFWLL